MGSLGFWGVLSPRVFLGVKKTLNLHIMSMINVKRWFELEPEIAKWPRLAKWPSVHVMTIIQQLVEV